jgi:hypothetical protein
MADVNSNTIHTATKHTLHYSTLHIVHALHTHCTHTLHRPYRSDISVLTRTSRPEASGEESSLDDFTLGFLCDEFLWELLRRLLVCVCVVLCICVCGRMYVRVCMHV